MDAGRLILDPPRSGSLNMSIDEFLLRRVSDSQRPCLRFYSWDSATVSLGYFQHVQERASHEPSAEIPLVRRATGGGAIVHDLELTYSLTVPIEDRLREGHRERYFDVHRAVINLLSEFGVRGELHPGDPSRQNDRFLCFQRRAHGDVVIGDWKVLGSAQRRHATGLLQHGSILLSTSAAAPELPGIAELANRCTNLGELKEGLIRAISQAMDFELVGDEVSDSELLDAGQIAREKFELAGWTNRR